MLINSKVIASNSISNKQTDSNQITIIENSTFNYINFLAENSSENSNKYALIKNYQGEKMAFLDNFFESKTFKNIILLAK